ncbi:5-oxoprolinase subunit C family protein [Advenella mimigardefordensis]|uniref:Histidine kinase inhibitor antagonist n=1 Tax=Advenella mimigardefordensis (strain DSM 17166 / LMG 22922 / DPN7) TaxID=1247726 RepID=W0P7F3_ADVMD|nr:biotin-dependent carboxyltransferase family protein [Advenella mimigardefordensis]AHG62666.1 histidine kinase inhibitor antagonist [Advenella mimigardefordensis DPN7]
MSLQVIKPGPLSLFQDAGRHGYQAYGAPVCGVMDQVAYRLANALVGNRTPLPVLEMTLSGPQIRFHKDACIAVCGAPFILRCDRQPLALNRPHLIRAGQVLEISAAPMPDGQPHGSARASLAIAGGVQLTTSMESASTDLKSRMGGIQGRALAKDDRLTLNRNINASAVNALAHFLDDFRIYLPAGLGLAARQHIRVIRGVHWTVFGTRQQDLFLNSPYTITAHSDRMGYRLDGPSLEPEAGLQILSEPTAFGTVQVPPDGQPIILMADRQTTGGYPKIANVASVDLPVLARCLPGERLAFALISLDHAHQLFREREALFAHLLQTLEPLTARIAAAFCD